MSSATISKKTLTSLSALDKMWDKVSAINDELLGSELSTRPANSFTAQEYATRYTLSLSGATARIRAMMKSGKLQRGNVRLVSSDGHVKRTYVYTVVI